MRENIMNKGIRESYSPEEFFQKLGISRSLGYKLIREGKIAAVRLGERRLIIPVSELDRLLRAGNE